MSPSGPRQEPARTVQCEACGAQIPVRQLAAAVTCPHCRHDQRLDPALLQSLSGYQRGVQDNLDHARGELERAARSEAQHAAIKTPAIQYVLGFGFVAGLSLITILTGVALMKSGIVDERTAGPLVSFAAVLSGGVGAALYGLSTLVLGRLRKPKTIGLQTARVACASCGAPNHLTPGKPVDKCAYCGAAVLPNRRAMDQGTAAARDAARGATLERMRRERDVVAGYQAYALQGHTIALMAGGPLTLLTGASAVSYTIDALTGDEPFDPAILGLWGMFLTAFVFVFGVVAYTFYRRQSMRSAVRKLAAALHGRELGELKDTVWWLNSYWAGPYPNNNLVRSDPYGSISAVVDGFRALVEYAPTQGRYLKPRLHVLVAAWFPGVSDGSGRAVAVSAEARRAHQQLIDQGFAVEQNPGGLLLRGGEPVLRAVRKNPARLEELAVTLQQAATLARGLGGEPV